MKTKITGKTKVKSTESRTLGGILIPPRRTLSVNTIFRAANILICLSNGVNTLTDIASQCQLSKSSVHRLLKSLQEPQLVISDSVNHRYYLGPLIKQLASNPKTSNELLISTCLPEMEHLSQVSGETISLVIMTGIRIIMIYEIPSKHSLKVTEFRESTHPISLGATQKVLLALLDDFELKSMLAAIKKEKAVDMSPENQLLLSTQLKRIRQQGYAVSYGERITGVVGISAPIRNYTNPVALSIVGPEGRMVPQLTTLIDELRPAAERISERLAESIHRIEH
jgi:DNA-binding IclR family transcriptional regulator